MPWEITWCTKQFVPIVEYEKDEDERRAKVDHGNWWRELMKNWTPFAATSGTNGPIYHFRRWMP